VFIFHAPYCIKNKFKRGNNAYENKYKDKHGACAQAVVEKNANNNSKNNAKNRPYRQLGQKGRGTINLPSFVFTQFRHRNIEQNYYSDCILN